MEERLVGKNIVLRKAKESDYKMMLENVWSNKEVYEKMLFKPTFSLEDAFERCQRSIEFQKNNYAYFVALKDTDEPIGFCGIRKKSNDTYEECGICISPKNQGNGYGKEVLGLLLDLVFIKLDANEFIYSYFSDNECSKRLAMHYNFQYDHKETIIREWDKKEKECEVTRLIKKDYLN